ncbi:uncharacterized protein Dwil_GK24689 [Drosophila willistoni]|uniref:H/ACA ribonucleoprotein complex non-core subunit NAF1 n=1 Tax=Drosophila willistoni TaxID=7260 RepID=B4MZN6_DROWI|nr:H/ACA ribonucleoprotein complex non-core subunit NAF1 [Drosophila willistoni]EDW77821.1 uncharacterized protein Dwil_GK24689 [Drosophila willistoni]
MDKVEPVALEQTDSVEANTEQVNQPQTSTEVTTEETLVVTTVEKGELTNAVEEMATPEESTKMDCESSTEAQVDAVVTKPNESTEKPSAIETTPNSMERSNAEPSIGASSLMETEKNPSEKTTATTNGLSLLATYSSDVDSDVEEVAPTQDDDVVEVPVTGCTAYRRSVAVAASSDSESEKSSSSSDSDSNSEGEYLTVLRKKIEKRINTEDCDEDDEDFDEDEAVGNGRPRGRRQPPKVRGEMLLDDLPPIHQLEITVPEDECVELGKVQSIVDQLVLVDVLPNSMLFDLDTVLFLEKGRKVLGQVFDVLGQVADPIYCVRFNSNQQIVDRDIKVGDVVYCAPKTEHTQFVILSKLMQVRGSDASWEHDVEPPERYIDYSDDEAEREARQDQRKRRQRDRTNSTDSVDTVQTEASSVAEPPARQRGRRAHRAESFRQHQQPQQQPRRQQQPQQQQQDFQQPLDASSHYNYHPSYNPGSWHSNYYHNFHPPPNNFNMPPQPAAMGMHFPVPNYGYGMPMGMPPHMMPAMPQMYAPPPPFGQPPPSSPQHNQRQPPRSGH